MNNADVIVMLFVQSALAFWAYTLSPARHSLRLIRLLLGSVPLIGAVISIAFIVFHARASNDRSDPPDRSTENDGI